ncbi:MAG: UxaA family hydrolase [Oscillospiraceae bacterium]
MKSVILGSESDNVVTCCAPIALGDEVAVGEKTVTAAQPIPVYHKMAISAIAAGAQVFKYGQPIGVASRDILPGQHVHVHNLESDRGRGDRKAAAK